MRYSRIQLDSEIKGVNDANDLQNFKNECKNENPRKLYSTIFKQFLKRKILPWIFWEIIIVVESFNQFMWVYMKAILRKWKVFYKCNYLKILIIAIFIRNDSIRDLLQVAVKYSRFHLPLLIIVMQNTNDI